MKRVSCWPGWGKGKAGRGYKKPPGYPEGFLRKSGEKSYFFFFAVFFAGAFLVTPLVHFLDEQAMVFSPFPVEC